MNSPWVSLRLFECWALILFLTGSIELFVLVSKSLVKIH